MIDYFVAPIELSISSVLLYLINAVIAFVIVVIADNLISHNMELKHSFILAILSFLVAPIAASFLGLYGAFAVIVLPLIVWVIVGELILESDWGTKLKVLIIAFIAYYIIAALFAGTLYDILRSILFL